MLNNNNITQLKTTILGCIFIIASFALQYFLFKQQDYSTNYVLIGLFAVGIVLILLPDTFLTALKNAIGLGLDYLKKIW